MTSDRDASMRTASLARELLRATARPPCIIYVAQGPDQGQWRRLEPGRPLTIGRGDECDFRLGDNELSRLHVELHLDATGQVIASDLSSKNGSRLGSARLGTGDVWPRELVLTLGQSTLRHAEHPPVIAPAPTRIATRRWPTWQLLVGTGLVLVAIGAWMLWQSQ